jgi:hypothetical protein
MVRQNVRSTVPRASTPLVSAHSRSVRVAPMHTIIVALSMSGVLQRRIREKGKLEQGCLQRGAAGSSVIIQFRWKYHDPPSPAS